MLDGSPAVDLEPHHTTINQQIWIHNAEVHSKPTHRGLAGQDVGEHEHGCSRNRQQQPGTGPAASGLVSGGAGE